MKISLSIILILSIVPYLYGQKKSKGKEDYSCVQRLNLSLKERLSFYPFKISRNISLVSFDATFNGLPVENDTICVSKLKESKTLIDEQVDTLTNLLYNIGVKGNTFKYTPATCYFPRNAILFKDGQGKVVEFIEICFECRRTRESSKKVDNGISCDQKFEILKDYFNRQGITYGILEEL